MRFVIGLAVLCSLPALADSGRCDCSKKIKACRASATRDGNWITLTSDDQRCSLVFWSTNGDPRTSVVLDSKEQVEWLGIGPPEIKIQSCDVCLDRSASKGSQGSKSGSDTRSKADDLFDEVFGTSGSASGQKPAGSSSTAVPDRLPKGDIMSVVLANKPSIVRCVNEQKARDPSLGGTLVMHWVIQTSGKTSSVNAVTDEFRSSYMATCLTGLVKSWNFPKHKYQPGEPVDFPFTFGPSGASPPRATLARDDEEQQRQLDEETAAIQRRRQEQREQWDREDAAQREEIRQAAQRLGGQLQQLTSQPARHSSPSTPSPSTPARQGNTSAATSSPGCCRGPNCACK